MLIDYKLLGNEALLRMKFFLQQWFRVSMKLCNVVNCILRIKCSLNLLVSYVCFDICGGVERASLRSHCVRMQFPKKFCPLCDKQENYQLRINFTCIFKVFPKLPLLKFWENLENTSGSNPYLPSGPCDYIC